MTSGVRADSLKGKQHRVSMSIMPAIPRIPPLWRESRIGLEAAALRRSPVFDGLGVPPGERRPVLLIPGFMAGDMSLGTLAGWLRRTAIAPTGRASAPTSTAPRRPAGASRRGSSTWPSATASA